MKGKIMNKETILYGVIALLGGIIIAGTTAVLAVNNDNHSMMGMMGMNPDRTHQQMMGDGSMSMGGMADELKNKSGDDFDRAFITQMIKHHQGAIDMANLAKQNAKHAEIKKMADDIISAQSKEIDQMRSWQIDWGYTNTPSSSSSEMMH